MATGNFRARFRERYGDSRALALVELLVAVAIVVANAFEVIPFSSTPFVLLFGWLMLWLRGVGWRQLGLRRPPLWARILLLGVGVGVAYQFVSLYLIEPLIARLTGRLPDVSQFAPLIGDEFLLLLSVIASWTLAAFGEELVFRAYLMNRVVDALGSRGRAAWGISLVSVSILFGLAHLYQGASGIVVATLSGLLFGALYLACGRNLWAAIIAHGVNDTIGFLLIYLGRYPGL